MNVCSLQTECIYLYLSTCIYLLIMNFVCMYDYVYNVYVFLGERAALKL